MPLVANPILPGFNPDPSILRVDNDYYIATSTFEWYPGVQIHHSRDLTNWTLLTRPLSRKSQLDMRGNPDSCGVWAPCLSHDGGKFWLVYTDVKRKDARSRTRITILSGPTRSTGRGPIRSTSIRPASIPACSTTMTAANGSSACCGITAAGPTCSPASACRTTIR